MKLIIAILLFVVAAVAQPPYAAPVAQTVCVMDTSVTPPVPAVDPITSVPQCFVIPPSVVAATNQFMTDQKSTDASGTVTYTYANLWDLITKHFINSLVLPMLDRYPPPDLAAVKAAATAAAAAVDSAKAAILAGQQ